MTIPQEAVTGLIFGCCALSIIYSIINVFVVSQIKQENTGEWPAGIPNEVKEPSMKKLRECEERISGGAITFLFQEYRIIAVFAVIFTAIVWAAVDERGFPWAAIAQVVGSLTSVLCGQLSMSIAVYANVRTTFMAMTTDANDDSKYNDSFKTAQRAGSVMGYVITGIGLAVLQLLFLIQQQTFPQDMTVQQCMEAIAGYGLGGSTIALFGRVGGGIYTKAADMGADLVGKVNNSMEEDDPNNPATIADNVGDNVGDIAGMGSDLFGSFAEATCATLVIAATSTEMATEATYMLQPLTITATGIVVSFVVSLLALHLPVRKDNIETTLKIQLVVSTVLMIPVMYILSLYLLPETFQFDDGIVQNQLGPFWAAFAGCVSGMIIGLCTEYYTSRTYSPVSELINNCLDQGGNAATNIVYGLALGYQSCIVPVICLAVTIQVAHTFAGMYGIAISALGMLSTMATALSIDGFGPISDNAGGIAEMALGDDRFSPTRKVTDVLDAAGNTTAAIGKGFAIGSAALVSLALFSAFVTRSGLSANASLTNILNPLVFSGLLIGALLPYWFSGMTVKSTGIAAREMCSVADRQIREWNGGQGKPIDYQECIEVSTKYSLREMIMPGFLVIGSPLIIGYLFGSSALSGLLAGSLVSGVQMAISMSNSGGAWDNCKKGLEALGYKKHEAQKHAVIGDTVGDPLKDTSGPSLNILMKLMAITSLVFAGSIGKYGGVLTKYISS